MCFYYYYTCGLLSSEDLYITPISHTSMVLRTYLQLFDYHFPSHYYTLYIYCNTVLTLALCRLKSGEESGTTDKASLVQKGASQCSRLKSSMPFKRDLALQIYLSQNNPLKHNPKLKRKMSLEVLIIICSSQEPTSVGHCH